MALGKGDGVVMVSPGATWEKIGATDARVHNNHFKIERMSGFLDAAES